MKLFPRLCYPSDVPIALFPKTDDFGHVAQMLEATKQHDQPGHVVRVVAPPDEALPGQRIVGVRFLQLNTRLLITERCGDRIAIPLVVLLGMGVGVAQKVKNRALLSFGPETLPFRIRTSGEKNVHALAGQPNKNDDDDQERPNDKQQAPTYGYEARDSVKRWHRAEKKLRPHKREIAPIKRVISNIETRALPKLVNRLQLPAVFIPAFAYVSFTAKKGR